MTIENMSDGVIFVELPKGSFHIRNELENLNQIISENCQTDVVMDFTHVEILISVNISNLLILRKMLEDQGHQLIFCNVAPLTKHIFELAGLLSIFNFTEDRTEAIQTIK